MCFVDNVGKLTYYEDDEHDESSLDDDDEEGECEFIRSIEFVELGCDDCNAATMAAAAAADAGVC